MSNKRARLAACLTAAAALAIAAPGCASKPVRPGSEDESTAKKAAEGGGASSTRAREARVRPRLSPKCHSFCGKIATHAFDVGHGDLAPLLCDLARCETGDKCVASIRSPNRLYRGAFQFSSGTWRSQCGPIFARMKLGSCRPGKMMNDLRCSTACASEIVARRGLGDWPACGRKISAYE